jgi:hypothetical protein
LVLLGAAAIAAGCDTDTTAVAGRQVVDLGIHLTWMTTAVAIVWAGVAYVAFAWADRLEVIRTPGTHAAILVGAGFVVPVIVLATVLALVLPLAAGAR